MTGVPALSGWPAKHLPKALLGYAIETLLSGRRSAASACAARVPSVWDAWWACYRAALPLSRLGAQIVVPSQACEPCRQDALTLAGQSPPGHPGIDAVRPCGCLRDWAMRMRAPAAAVTWPPLSLTLALAKPDAPAARIRELLGASYDVALSVTGRLSTLDTRRLYPEAYGAPYVAARDSYMTSGPVTALVLRARDPQAAPDARVKDRIRCRLAADRVHNHLHMPDNPGEALADIAHFAGLPALAGLYERHERDRAGPRLAFYRAALGIADPGAHRCAS